MKRIQSPSDLARFSVAWNLRQKIQLNTAPRFAFKIEIHEGPEKGLWLYDPEGYVQYRNIFKKPVYVIRNPDEFNRILGINE